MDLENIIERYMKYNHSGYILRRKRLKGEEKTVVDLAQEIIMIGDISKTFSLSRHDATVAYSKWFENNFEK